MAAILAVKRLAGVTLEVNLLENTCVTHTPPPSVKIRLPTLTLKLRGDITISPKQRYQWSHRRTYALQKNFFLNVLIAENLEWNTSGKEKNNQVSKTGFEKCCKNQADVVHSKTS